MGREDLKYWNAKALVPEQKKSGGLEEQFPTMVSGSIFLSAMLVVVNIVNVLQLYPEFFTFMTRAWEIFIMPPDLVREMYPDLFAGSIYAATASTTALLSLEIVYSSLKGQQVPVFKGPWKIIHAVTFAFAYVSNMICFIATKSIVAAANMAILSITMPVAFSNRMDRVAEEINKILRGAG
ncbi:MAG: hypothetical protein ACP5IE_00170 [Infirmifilum sp.]